MLKRTFIFFTVLIFLLNFPVLSTKVKKGDLDATHILIGKVKKVESYYSVNNWGDVLILSNVNVKIERKLKGEIEDSVSFIVEGGTVEEITLKVSEYPLFTEGERVKLHLKKIKDVFNFISSETLEARPGGGKPDKKPGGNKGCCKTFAQWKNTNVPYHIVPDNNDVSPNCIINDILAGADGWNQVSEINLIYDESPGFSIVDLNGSNDIFFRPDASGSTIAATYVWYLKKGKEIIEFDMVFYDGAWNFFSLSCSPESCVEGFYVLTIAAHELGHAIGIDHNRCATSIMYPYASYCDTNTLSDDDVACASDLYK